MTWRTLSGQNFSPNFIRLAAPASIYLCNDTRNACDTARLCHLEVHHLQPFDESCGRSTVDQTASTSDGLI
jgi:hypothetical protein